MLKGLIKIAIVGAALFVLSCNNQRTVLGGNDIECIASVLPYQSTVSVNSQGQPTAPVDATLEIEILNGSAKLKSLKEVSFKKFTADVVSNQLKTSHVLDLQLKELGNFEFNVTVENGSLTGSCLATAKVSSNSETNPLSCTAALSPAISTAQTNAGTVITPAAVKLNVNVTNGPAAITALTELASKTFSHTTALPTSAKTSHALDVDLKQTGDFDIRVSIASGSRTATCVAEGTVNGSAAVSPSVTLYTEDGSDVAEVPNKGSLLLAWVGQNVDTCKIFKNDVLQTHLTTGRTGLFDTGPLVLSSNIYRVECTGPANPTTPVVDYVAVTALPAPKAYLTVTWAGEPNPLVNGGSVNVSWDSDDALSCDIFRGTTAVLPRKRPTSGTTTVSSLTGATTIKVICEDALPNYAEASVDVPVAAPLPALSISANPTSVAYDKPTTVTFSATNATGCYVTRARLDGTQQVNLGSVSPITERLTASSRYTLLCNGGLSKNVVVEVGNPVDHLIFVTTTSYNGALVSTDAAENSAVTGQSGLTRGDSMCRYRAQQANLRVDRPWKAILSNSAINARDRIQILGPVYAWNGTTKIADNIWNGSILASIPTQSGGSVGDTSAWTGTTGYGYKAGNYCQDWTSSVGSYTIEEDDDDDDDDDDDVTVNVLGSVGDTGDWNYEWLGDAAPMNCNSYLKLYCISQ